MTAFSADAFARVATAQRKRGVGGASERFVVLVSTVVSTSYGYDHKVRYLPVGFPSDVAVKPIPSNQ